MKGNVLNQTTMSLRQNETSYTIIFLRTISKSQLRKGHGPWCDLIHLAKKSSARSNATGFLGISKHGSCYHGLFMALHAKVHSTSKGIGKPWLESWYCKSCIHELYFKWKPESIFICFFIWFVSSISAPFLSIASFMAEDEARKLEKDRTGYFGGERARVAIGGPQPINAESWTSKWGLGRHFII